MVKKFLYPLAWLYGMVIYSRNRMYDLKIFKSKEFDVPIISIGNITVGGTGKTPHVEYLVNLLRNKFVVATLSRGYKRKTKGFKLVETKSTVAEVGDEPLQIKNKFPDITVSVCENRVDGTERLLNTDKCKIPNVVLLDDAFQHRRITPGINILLIDYNRQIHDDALLPAGRLREGAGQICRADVIIFTKCPDGITSDTLQNLKNKIALNSNQDLFFTALEYEKLIPVFSAEKLGNDFYLDKSFSILIVTGIASPKLIHKYLEQFSAGTDTLTFPDHYNFNRNDISSILNSFERMDTERKIIVTTEKDAMRLKNRQDLSDKFKNALYYLPVKVKFLEDNGKAFNQKILNYVEGNKGNV